MTNRINVYSDTPIPFRFRIQVIRMAYVLGWVPIGDVLRILFFGRTGAYDEAPKKEDHEQA